jgi:hypothetical protein
MSGAIPPLSQYASIALCSVKAQGELLNIVTSGGMEWKRKPRKPRWGPEDDITRKSERHEEILSSNNCIFPGIFSRKGKIRAVLRL